MVTEAEARRLRPFMSGIVALVVAVAATMVWYFMGRPDETPVPVRTVDWSAWVKAGRADHRLALFAPDALPKGWRATSASYVGGNDPRFEIGMLTEDGKYVGIVESESSVRTLVRQNIDDKAERGEDVTLNDTTSAWQVWTDSGGDYGVALDVENPDGTSETVLVFGSAPDDEIRDFAATLRPGTVPLS
ncbi:hypothetical protein ABIE44_000979 [Marmoricola sp. OAE513]|uniref:DUF4245 family protein n=1 Tax=Marmoricola sp. OAE513 TaxID=2817894 RepID=UPI001AE2DB37